MGIIKKKVRKLEDQLEYESRRWGETVTNMNTFYHVLEPDLTLVALDYGGTWRWTWSWKTSTLRQKPNIVWRRNKEPKPERGKRRSSSGRPGWGCQNNRFWVIKTVEGREEEGGGGLESQVEIQWVFFNSGFLFATLPLSSDWVRNPSCPFYCSFFRGLTGVLVVSLVVLPAHSLCFMATSCS